LYSTFKTIKGLSGAWKIIGSIYMGVTRNTFCDNGKGHLGRADPRAEERRSGDPFKEHNLIVPEADCGLGARALLILETS
jgi:hypothetical protein